LIRLLKAKQRVLHFIALPSRCFLETGTAHTDGQTGAADNAVA